MTSSILFRSMAVLLGSYEMTLRESVGSITLPSLSLKATPTRNGNKSSGAARLKRSAIKRSMAKARASKRFN